MHRLWSAGGVAVEGLGDLSVFHVNRFFLAFGLFPLMAALQLRGWF
ncbi:MAG: hypothetical protein JWO08_3515 [Verrucomicrobiaceae bacterium]|nr:hypothetical protein [Verrucomicrobiaceae bacterium]